MIATDREALMCDLAETYKIYDYKSLPCYMVAIFSCGLRDNSRIKMKLINAKADSQTLLLASISDRLGTLVWFNSEDGRRGVNRPRSILQLLTTEKEVGNSDLMTFSSGYEFDAYRNMVLEGMV